MTTNNQSFILYNLLGVMKNQVNAIIQLGDDDTLSRKQLQNSISEMCFQLDVLADSMLEKIHLDDALNAVVDTEPTLQADKKLKQRIKQLERDNARLSSSLKYLSRKILSEDEYVNKTLSQYQQENKKRLKSENKKLSTTLKDITQKIISES